jgi:hypothetical protein
VYSEDFADDLVELTYTIQQNNLSRYPRSYIFKQVSAQWVFPWETKGHMLNRYRDMDKIKHVCKENLGQNSHTGMKDPMCCAYMGLLGP